MTIVFLTPITPLHARWIGDMARDYSWRLEQDRVSRESVSSARERRIQERKEKELRAGGRTRLVPLQKDYNETEALLGPAALRTKKIQRLQARGSAARVLRTSEEKERYLDTRTEARYDARRRSDLGLLIDILMPFVLNPKREYADQLPTTKSEICRTNAASCTGFLRLDDLLTGSELRGFPADPSADPEENGTGYFIIKIGSTKLRLSAPLGNGGEGIEMESSAP